MKIKTPIRYAGGKSKAIGQITPFIKNEQKIISPFFGGGSLEVSWASQGKEVIGYDIFFALSNFWDVFLNRKEELIKEMKSIEPTIENYNSIKEILLCWNKTQEMLEGWKTNHYKRTPIHLENVKAAAYYYFNHNLSYGPCFLGWLGKPTQIKEIWERMIEQIILFQKPNSLNVFNSDFINVLEKHKNDFLYLDPPYFLDKDSDNKMFGGIYPMKNFPVYHDNFQHKQLLDLLKEHKGNFVLSYNNCETIRNWYSDFKFYFPKWNYSLGNGETRIGKNRQISNSNVKESSEILIVSKNMEFDY